MEILSFLSGHPVWDYWKMEPFYSSACSLSLCFISLPHRGLTGLQNFTWIYQLLCGCFLGTLTLFHPLESPTLNDFTSDMPPLSQKSFHIFHLPIKRTSFAIFLIQVLPSSFLSLFLFSSSFLHITLLLLWMNMTLWNIIILYTKQQKLPITWYPMPTPSARPRNSTSNLLCYLIVVTEVYFEILCYVL